jgi:hypothetical protein
MYTSQEQEHDTFLKGIVSIEINLRFQKRLNQLP